MRVGIVGIGWWSDVLAGVIAKSDKLELRAGYSRSANKTAKFAETLAVKPWAPMRRCSRWTTSTVSS